jgi:alkylated DNA repair dioxygenase AlkB
MQIDDLFATQTLASEQETIKVPGLAYHGDFLSADEAARIVAHIDNADWITDLKRRVQHYGFKYDYKAKSVDESMRIADLPLWAERMGNRLVNLGLFSTVPDQVIVNEYLPGQGITPHVDCVPCFGEAVASVSLMSPCVMRFISLHGKGTVDVDLIPGSVVLIAGESRYEWKHGIMARKCDRIDGVVRPRARRISATFRTVILKKNRHNRK